MDSDRLTVEEASRRWGRSTRTIFRWIEQGKLEAFREGNVTLVNPERPVLTKTQRVIESDNRERQKTVVSQSIMAQYDTMASDLRTANKRQFRWQCVALTMFVTVAALLSVIGAAWGIYSGTLQRLSDTQATLSASRDRVKLEQARTQENEKRLTAAEQRAIIAEEQTRELAIQVAEALKAEAERDRGNPWAY